METRKHKLSASALNTFLDSPKKYYWAYIARLVPFQTSVATYDHDKICGILWAEFVNRFYERADETQNCKQLLGDWLQQTDGWVPEKARDRLTKALETWSRSYYQMFNPDDGVRGKGKSELLVENDRFLGYLDGLSDDGVVHEVKSTSRSPQLAGQLWKVQNSIQVKLYCVLAKANGVRIEFAWKDPPNALYRGPETQVSNQQLVGWEQELNKLADYIYSLGDDPQNYPCHADGCNLVTKGITSMCQYETLCDMGLTDFTKIGYKEKTRREQKNAAPQALESPVVE
jgi:hypothetical protein